jgi:hypothetical protein
VSLYGATSSRGRRSLKNLVHRTLNPLASIGVDDLERRRRASPRSPLVAAAGQAFGFAGLSVIKTWVPEARPVVSSMDSFLGNPEKGLSCVVTRHLLFTTSCSQNGFNAMPQLRNRKRFIFRSIGLHYRISHRTFTLLLWE